MAAADLGASGGRVMAARVGPGRLEAREVSRFPNGGVRAGGTLYWDILRLYADVLDGLRAAARDHHLDAAGIDSWAVDFGLLDATGTLLANPVHYRDEHAAGAVDRVLARVSAPELYAVTGIAQLPFNTIFQLAAAAGTPRLEAAATLLLIPDLLGYWLTGERGAERTNASTTQLYDVRAGEWAWQVIDRAGLPRRIFPGLRDPGTVTGTVLPDIAAAAGLPPGLPVIAAGSHDTASAVVAVPAQERHFAYISSGTWSLVGMELPQPVLTEASRRAGFTNETGIDGTTRYLRNVSGLWLLQESLRHWRAAGGRPDLAGLLAGAARLPPLTSVIDAEDPAFGPPGDMPARIRQACARHGQPVPDSPAAVVRCVLDSLALAYRRAVLAVQELSGQHAEVIHVVGGGARNELLCQLTADACGLPVMAGPAEAAVLGNALVQARALGAAPGSLDGMRRLVRATQPLRTFRPASDGTGQRAWKQAAARLDGLP